MESTPVTTTTTEPEPEQTTQPAPTIEPATTSEPVPTTQPEPEPRVYDFAAVSPVVQRFVDERGLNGAGLVIVQRDDGVIYEDYWGEFDHDRISLVASSSKMITAGVLLRLHDDRIVAAYDGSAGPDTGYAMGWWVDRNIGRISDPGAYGSVPWLDLEDGYGAYLVIEAEADAGTGLELAAQLHDLVETAVTSFD